jgi:hypothetical protein
MAPPQILKLQRYTIYRTHKFTQTLKKKFFKLIIFFEGLNDPPSFLHFYIKTPPHTLKYHQ